jgi:mRNA-degrading endonuclease RelE of RelBE toxin-antitoxin system
MEYLISYFVVGLFLALAAFMHGVFSRAKGILPFVVTVFLWPVLVLFAPESFLKSSYAESGSALTEQDTLKEKLASFLESAPSQLSGEETQRLARVAKYGDEYITIFGERSDFPEILAMFWESNVPPENYYAFKRAHYHLDESYYPASQPLFSRIPPDWYIGFSSEFVKSIAKVDRKKQGRILEALGRIAAAPTEACGDTIKPLTGGLAGLWRCRMGDDRLIYFPDTQSKKVVLISFGSRGDAYQDSVDVAAIANAINR